MQKKFSIYINFTVKKFMNQLHMLQLLHGLACQVLWISFPMFFSFEISAPALRAVSIDHPYFVRNIIRCLPGSVFLRQLCVPVNKFGD